MENKTDNEGKWHLSGNNEEIQARKEAEKLLEKKVMLRLWVKVKKDWRSDEKGIRAFGFRDTEI